MNLCTLRPLCCLIFSWLTQIVAVTKGGVGQHQNELSLSELEYSLKVRTTDAALNGK